MNDPQNGKDKVGVIHNRRMRKPDQSPKGDKRSTIKTKHDNGCFRTIAKGAQREKTGNASSTYLSCSLERTERRLCWYHPRYFHSY